MISLKRFLDSDSPAFAKGAGHCTTETCSALWSAYRASLAELGECGAAACPSLASELQSGLTRIQEELGERSEASAITTSRDALRELVQGWNKKTALHYVQKAGEVKDLLLVMARTAESLALKDDRYARQLEMVTAQLQTIAKLDDVTRIRTSVEESAGRLRSSVERMTAESKVVIDHLRVEISMCQAKLEKAEHIAACDALTGLGSRLWAEARIQQRIDSRAPFCILLIDVDGLRRVNQEYGNLVADLIRKEFARELRSSCRFSDLVARWESDEFVVVQDSTEVAARAQIARLHSWVAGPYHVPGRSDQVNTWLDVSIGLAEYREGDSLQDILERAHLGLGAERGLLRNELTA